MIVPQVISGIARCSVALQTKNMLPVNAGAPPADVCNSFRGQMSALNQRSRQKVNAIAEHLKSAILQSFTLLNLD